MRARFKAYLPTLTRIFRGTQYLILATAGTWMLTAPTALLQTAMGKVIYGWAAFLVLGGVLCSLGTLTKIWAGEFVGLVLLIFGNVIWGGTLISASPNSAKYGLVLIAWGFGLTAREFQIMEKARGAASAEKQRRKAGRRRTDG